MCGVRQTQCATLGALDLGYPRFIGSIPVEKVPDLGVRGQKLGVEGIMPVELTLFANHAASLRAVDPASTSATESDHNPAARR
jgi:hypothetical protein